MIETQKGQPGYNSNSVTSGSMALDLPEGEITTDVTWEGVFFNRAIEHTPGELTIITLNLFKSIIDFLEFGR